MTGLEAFGYGTLGGFLLNVLALAELATVPKIERPPTFSDPLWVFKFLAIPAVGGALTLVYQQDGVLLRPFLAVNVGLTAPAIIKALGAAAPKNLGKTD